jgi:hypothetical protein
MEMEPKTYLNWIEDKSDKIQEILIDLGYQLSDRGRYWQSTAVYRDGDNQTALQIWKDTGIWKDFVQGSSYQPFKRLLQLSCRDDNRLNELLEVLDEKNDSFIPTVKAPKMEIEQFFSHDDVGTLLPHYSFYNNKGISDQTLELYKAGFSMSGKMNGRFTFPIYDDNGKVIGLSGRHLLWDNKKSITKWKHLGRKGRWIYPLNIPNENDIFVKSIEEKKEIIIIEGIGDSLALSEQGIYNHMVAFGLDFSSKQIAYLISLNIDKIIIATNNDAGKKTNAGRDAAIKLFLKLIKYIDIGKIEIKLPVMNDFGEMLENDVDINLWINKNKSKAKQIQYILNNYEVNDKKCVKILKDYLDQLSFEADSLSQ